MAFTYEYPRPAVTADALIFSKNESSFKILLIQRLKEPFKGKWALPGGFLDMDEDLDRAAGRELKEETGLSGVTLKQFKAYGNINRDPRHRTITVAYVGMIDKEQEVTGLDDAADARWFDINALPLLAFDHDIIVSDAIEAFVLNN
ncbi:NUDIX hydrolase [Marinilabiliaceae bacterium JC017]|nr:NUDIX hydrolase [Marinilabiliaceae bacterium JC017]